MDVIYGPVPSWRFGLSLGIDATTLPKKCTFSCIYCQLGRTKLYVSEPEKIQDQLPKPKEVDESLQKHLEKIDANSIDFVTVSGTGEPTLNLSLPEIVDVIRSYIPRKPLGILTNASLAGRSYVQETLLEFDFVSAKFDAGDEETYHLINRPSKNVESLSEIKEGIKILVGKAKKTTVALETMLLKTVQGLSNIHGWRYDRLVSGILEINPQLVQLYTPWRPSAESFVRPASQEEINRVANDLASKLGKETLWVYGEHDARIGKASWSKIEAYDEILNLISRRPCRVTDITYSLSIPFGLAFEYLNRMVIEKKAEIKYVNGERFYQISG